MINLQLSGNLKPSLVVGITEHLMDAILSGEFFSFFKNTNPETQDFLAKIKVQYDAGDPLIREYVDKKHYLLIFKKELKQRIIAELDAKYQVGKTERICTSLINLHDAPQKWLLLNTHFPWDKGIIEPSTEVIILGRNQQKARINSGITSGIQFPVFPKYYAQPLGFDLKREGDPISIRTPFGNSITVTEVKDVCLHVFRKKILTNCYFIKNDIALLNLEIVIKVNHLGFNQYGWFA